MPELENVADADSALKTAGLEQRYYLIGHPAWPDPLCIWPPTEENAADYHAKYVAGFNPPAHVDKAAYSPRIGVRWEHVGAMPTWEPPVPPAGSPDAKQQDLEGGSVCPGSEA